jgi:hypothetical protein
MGTYSEKLKDPRWQRLRLEIFQRDDFACRKCGDKTRTLAVHHLYYERGREPWEYPATALVTLCEPCHGEEFEAKDADRELLIALKQCGAFTEQISMLASMFDQQNPISSDGGGIWPRPLTAFEWATVLWHFDRLLIRAFRPGGTDELFEEHRKAVGGRGFEPK